MSRIRPALGYLWAALALPLVLAAFLKLGTWSRGLVELTEVGISPWFTGGSVARTIQHEGFETQIHRPVFDGLFWEGDVGFVQVDWVAVGGDLPEMIEESIDFDADGTEDLRIHLGTGTNQATLLEKSVHVTSVDPVLDFGPRHKAVRIQLDKEP